MILKFGKLQLSGELDIEVLRAKYAGAYDSDFEIPDDSEEESTDINASEDEEEVESEGKSETFSIIEQ